MKNLVFVFASAAFLAACASEGGAQMAPMQEKEYQTGSNIAKKKTGAVVVDRDTLERTQELNMPHIPPGKGN